FMSDATLRGLNNALDRSDGIILLLFLSIFLCYAFEVGRNNRKQAHRDTEPVNESWGKSLLLILIGLVGILFGGNMVVNNATTIAYSLGMSETLVGLTVIAIGTSLPELVPPFPAVLKKKIEFAFEIF